MLPLRNSVVTTFWIVCILFSQIAILDGQFADSPPLDDIASSDESPSSNPDGDFLGSVRDALNNYVPGRTFQYDALSNMITDSRMLDDQCEFRLMRDMKNYLGDKLIIGEISTIKQIVSVKLSFHDDNDELIRDDDGNPIIYRSNRRELGHVLDIFHQGLAFSYAKCLLQLQPKSNFDLRNLFFHFGRPSLPTNNLPAVINGSTLFYLDSPTQAYNVSGICPLAFTCMWLLNDAVLFMSPNTSIVYTFEPKHIGNQTLSYVGYFSGNPQILASLVISILPTTTYVCNTLDKKIVNRWLLGGNMSSPRVYFTVTYLPRSKKVIIAGGTADNSNALSSADIYDPDTGCYNLTNMTSPRMKHTAVMLDNFDMALLVGGVTQGENVLQQTDLIPLTDTQVPPSLEQGRYFHETVSTPNLTILVVAGRGLNDSSVQFEICDPDSNGFESLGFFNSTQNFEGHSATLLGNSGNILIFGGYNGIRYSATAWIINGTNLPTAATASITNGTNSSEGATNNTSGIAARAYHQATYIPGINAVLITGGDNGTNTLSSCYLYHVSTGVFTATGSMNIPRSFHAAFLLSNRSVLVIGGAAAIVNGQPQEALRSVERYDPQTGTFSFVAFLNIPRYRHKVVGAQANRIFVFGGMDTNGNILSSFEYLVLPAGLGR